MLCKKACHKLANRVDLILTAYMYDNLKLEHPWTMCKTNKLKPIYLVNNVHISSLQALYKPLCENKLNVIIAMHKIYV